MTQFITRTACCMDPARRCGTRFTELLEWVHKRTGKGVKLVRLSGTQMGETPFFSQPVGFDGRFFYVAEDPGCDTEKLLHDACHHLVAPKARRQRVNWGLARELKDAVPQAEADQEEVTTALLQHMLAPHFRLRPDQMKRPDYNVANRRNVDWDLAQERAEAFYAELLPTLAHLPA